LATNLRIALLGGSDLVRKSRRTILESQTSFRVVFDNDAHQFEPQTLLEATFDVLIVDQRLDSISAFDFVRELHKTARFRGIHVGNILISGQFNELQLRLAAIAAGAVDFVFISDGVESLLEKVTKCAEKDTDFAIREILPELQSFEVSQDHFQKTISKLDVLDENEALILKSFCELRSDSQIATAVAVPKAKVRRTLTKIQSLLMLDTRSQLLLQMYNIGALAL
jgi:DNA-binding NarL/FixJ family response regulator